MSSFISLLTKWSGGGEEEAEEKQQQRDEGLHGVHGAVSNDGVWIVNTCDRFYTQFSEISISISELLQFNACRFSIFEIFKDFKIIIRLLCLHQPTFKNV